MKYIDLHVHTSASDGTMTPREVIKLASEKGLSAISVTDHDTTDGIDEAVSAGIEFNIEVVPGIELSCALDKKEIHILGYYIDYRNKEFSDRLNELKKVRDNRNDMIAEKFNAMGIPVSMKEMHEMYPDAIITRAHFASYIYEKGYAGSIKEVFDRYLNDNGPCFVAREKLNPAETINMIHKTGGLAFLAHPVRYRLGKSELEKTVKLLAEYGLDGLEAVYSTYTLSDETQIRMLAKENRLIISGGSDFHGSNKPFIELGKVKGHPAIPYDILSNIKANLR